jgi:hypothetical protein
MKKLFPLFLSLSFLGGSFYLLGTQIYKHRKQVELNRKMDEPQLSPGDCITKKPRPDMEEWQQTKERYVELIVQVGKSNYRTLGNFSDSLVILDDTQPFAWAYRFYDVSECPKIFQPASEVLKSGKPNVRIEYGYGTLKVSHD